MPPKFRSRKWNYSRTNPPPLPGYANVIPQIDGLDISFSYLAGAGNAIYRTLFDDEPPTPADGAADFYSNADVISRWSEALQVWQTYAPIFAVERPLPKLANVTDWFTPINQGGATTDTTHSGIHLVAPPGSSTDLHLWSISLGSPPTATGDLLFLVSHDPHAEHWEEIFRITEATYLVPDEVGFFINEESASGLNARATLLHWLVSARFASSPLSSPLNSPPDFNIGVEAGWLANHFGLDKQAYGIFLRESSSGKLITLEHTTTSSGLLLAVNAYTDPNTLDIPYFTQIMLAPFMFMRIEFQEGIILNPCPPFTNAIRITIDHTQLPSGQSNFIVGLEITDARLRTIANGGFVTSANGYDIRPTLSYANCSNLTYELEENAYDPVNGVLLMWVLLSFVNGADAASDTEFQLNFGNSLLTTDGSSDTTWSGYSSVLHLNVIGSGVAATRNSINFNSTGTRWRNIEYFSGNLVTEGVAQIGNGGDFDGVRGEIRDDPGNPAMLATGTNDWTFSVWIKTSVSSGGQVIASRVNHLICSGFLESYWYLATSNGKPKVAFANDGQTQSQSLTGSGSVSDNAWHHLVFTRVGATVKIYIDGTLDSSNTGSVTVSFDNDGGFNEIGYIAVGNCGSLFGLDPFTGLIDEWRAIDGTAWDADRVLAEYNAQANTKNPSSFYTVT